MTKILSQMDSQGLTLLSSMMWTSQRDICIKMIVSLASSGYEGKGLKKLDSKGVVNEEGQSGGEEDLKEYGEYH